MVVPGLEDSVPCVSNWKTPARLEDVADGAAF